MKLTTAKLLLTSVALATCAFGGALVAAPGIAGMSTAPATVLASGDDDDFEDFCDHYDGEHELPGNNGVFQHPCQSKDNSVGRGKVGILGHEFER